MTRGVLLRLEGPEGGWPGVLAQATLATADAHDRWVPVRPPECVRKGRSCSETQLLEPRPGGAPPATGFR